MRQLAGHSKISQVFFMLIEIETVPAAGGGLCCVLCRRADLFFLRAASSLLITCGACYNNIGCLLFTRGAVLLAGAQDITELPRHLGLVSALRFLDRTPSEVSVARSCSLGGER